jgi:hypothetical protein
MNSLENIKEASRKKSLGELGELFAIKTLVDFEYDKIRNLNDFRMNEEFVDLSCEKDGIRYLVSVKSRNKHQINGKINTRYNLGSNVYEKAKKAELKFNGIAYWMAVQFDAHEYSVFFGSLMVLNGSKAIPINKCMDGNIGLILVDRKRHYFDFDFYKNKKISNQINLIEQQELTTNHA